MSLYLLCFPRGLRRDDRAHVRHYLGFTAGAVEARVADHLDGRGSPLVKAAVRAGLTPVVARTWPDGDRTFERQLKRRRNLPKLCPVCAGPAAMKRGRP